jgi:ubiquitin C-terminal hydrolase
VRIQQDAQEYMGVAFDKIENLIKHSPHRYLMHDVFAGQVCAIKTCGNCGKVDESIDDFINLTLQVNNQRSIGDGLRKYTD